MNNPILPGEHENYSPEVLREAALLILDTRYRKFLDEDKGVSLVYIVRPGRKRIRRIFEMCDKCVMGTDSVNIHLCEVVAKYLEEIGNIKSVGLIKILVSYWWKYSTSITQKDIDDNTWKFVN